MCVCFLTLALTAALDFEGPDPFVGLTLEGTVTCERPLVWQPLEVRFATGEATALSVVLSLAGPDAEAWFDALETSLGDGRGLASRSAWAPAPPATSEGPGNSGPLRLGAADLVETRAEIACEALTEGWLRAACACVGEGSSASVSVLPRGLGASDLSPLASVSLEAREAPSRLGQGLARVAHGAAIRLDRSFRAGCPIAVTCDIRAPQGGSALIRVDQSDGRTLTRTVVAGPRNWTRISPLRLLAPDDSPLRLSVTASGGVLEIDNLEFARPDMPFGDVTPNPAAPPFRARGALLTSVDRHVSDPGVNWALPLVGQALASEASPDLSPSGLHLERDARLGSLEYRLTVARDRALLTAGGPEGARCGLLQLVDLLSFSPDGPAVLACEASGRPALAWRVVGPVDSEDRASLEALARLRCSHVLVAPDRAATAPTSRAFADLVAVARSYGLAPIPVLRAWGGAVLRRGPDLADRRAVDAEEVRLPESGAVALAHVNVVASAERRPTVASLAGAAYREGVDFAIRPGSTVFGPSGFDPEAEPWRIERIEGGAIGPGETVHVRYEYVGAVGSLEVPLCHADPRVAAFLVEGLRVLLREHSPPAVFVDFGGLRPEGLDALSLASEEPVERCLLLTLRALAAEARAVDPDLRLIVRAKDLCGSDAPEDLAVTWTPLNVILVAPTPDSRAEETLRAWARRGHSLIVSVEDRPGLPSAAARACVALNRTGVDCLGLLPTASPLREAPVMEAAEAGWRGR